MGVSAVSDVLEVEGKFAGRLAGSIWQRTRTSRGLEQRVQFLR